MLSIPTTFGFRIVRLMIVLCCGPIDVSSISFATTTVRSTGRAGYRGIINIFRYKTILERVRKGIATCVKDEKRHSCKRQGIMRNKKINCDVFLNNIKEECVKKVTNCI